jgi:hypothetical protein
MEVELKFSKKVFFLSIYFINRKSIRFFLAPSQDASLNNIILGIGLVVVILILLVIAIKLIYKCYKMCKEDDEKDKDPSMIRK